MKAAEGAGETGPASAGGLARALALVLVAAVGLAGCGIVERMTGTSARKKEQAEAAKAQAQMLQQQVMRFGDLYISEVIRETSRLSETLQADETPDTAETKKARIDMVRWQFVQATAAVHIGAGPNPAANALDMLALVYLNGRIVARTWEARYGPAAARVEALYRRLEPEAWKLVEEVMDDSQVEEVRRLLDGILEEHSDIESAAFLRFGSFVQAGGVPASKVSPGLLGIIGLDPLEGIDPAVKEFEQTRQLAERAVYYAQRLPVLLELQLKAASLRSLHSEEGQVLMETVEDLNRLSESLASLSDSAPTVIAREREAAIDQFMAALAAQQGQMLALATELRQALEAGALTAGNLDTAVNSADRLMARFEPDPDAPPREPGRPFDINDYTRLATELATTARELQALLDEVDGLTPQILDRADRLAVEARGLVDYAFGRLLLLVGAILAAALVYLAVARTWRRPAA